MAIRTVVSERRLKIRMILGCQTTCCQRGLRLPLSEQPDARQPLIHSPTDTRQSIHDGVQAASIAT